MVTNEKNRTGAAENCAIPEINQVGTERCGTLGPIEAPRVFSTHPAPLAEAKSGLWYRCRDFITEQSAGEWDDKTIADDADKLMAFVNSEGAGNDQRSVEMLALLKRALPGLETLARTADAEWCEHDQAIVDETKAVIAKATGAS